MQIIKIRDIIRPPEKEKFSDVYIVYELMDTDLHQIIRSKQELTDDHCQVSLIPRMLASNLLICRNGKLLDGTSLLNNFSRMDLPKSWSCGIYTR